jgi:hypothetical protein
LILPDFDGLDFGSVDFSQMRVLCHWILLETAVMMRELSLLGSVVGFFSEAVYLES